MLFLILRTAKQMSWGGACAFAGASGTTSEPCKDFVQNSTSHPHSGLVIARNSAHLRSAESVIAEEESDQRRCRGEAQPRPVVTSSPVSQYLGQAPLPST